MDNRERRIKKTTASFRLDKTQFLVDNFVDRLWRSLFNHIAYLLSPQPGLLAQHFLPASAHIFLRHA